MLVVLICGKIRGARVCFDFHNLGYTMLALKLGENHKFVALARLYEQLFAPMVAEEGLPDQLLTDKGTEWCIMAFVCTLAARRFGGPRQRRPHRFVESKRNVRRTVQPSLALL